MLSDMDLVNELSNYGFHFVDTGGAFQRTEKAPLVVLSTPGGNTPLIKIATFQFRYDNPNVVDAPALARHNGIYEKESLWVELNYNMELGDFEVSPAKVKITPRGVPIPAYRANTLFNQGQRVLLPGSSEVIEDAKTYEALPDYKQKEFDSEIIGALMIERIKRYLNKHGYHVEDHKFIDGSDNTNLRLSLTNQDKEYIIHRINEFVDAKPKSNINNNDVIDKVVQ